MTKQITHQGVVFTAKQWFSFNQCIQNMEQYASEHQEVVVENLESFSNRIIFTLSKKAKPNTGMLFLVDTSFTVLIGKNGGVQSQDNRKENRMTINKNRIFI